MYPARTNEADTLLKAVDKLNRVGPFQKGQKPNALRKYRANKKSFVGPRQQIILPVATVAYWNNFGNKRIKKRPFFTDMITEESPKWGAKLASILIKTGYNSANALGRMGEVIQGQLIKKIVDWPADNAPLTVAIKGFNKGLIDKGVMQRSTGVEVIK